MNKKSQRIHKMSKKDKNKFLKMDKNVKNNIII